MYLRYYGTSPYVLTAYRLTPPLLPKVISRKITTLQSLTTYIRLNKVKHRIWIIVVSTQC